MRPYQFGKLWIDLDTVQAISEARFVDRMGYGGYFIEMEIQFAFQDKPRLFQWAQTTTWRNKAGEECKWADDPHVRIAPKLNEEGEPSDLPKIRGLIADLLTAWRAK